MNKQKADEILEGYYKAGFLAAPPTDELKAVAYILEDRWTYWNALLGVLKDCPPPVASTADLNTAEHLTGILQAQQDFFIRLLVGFAEGVEHNIARRLGSCVPHSPSGLLGPQTGPGGAATT